MTLGMRSQIVAGIRAGGYPHVSAEAWSMPVRVFDDWLKRGAAPRARKPYAEFAEAVREAEAQARLRAEIEVHQAEPKTWLEHGPGRDTADRPGWSAPVRAAARSPQGRNALLDGELMSLFQTVLQALAPFPEARAQVAAALARRGTPAAE
jgi:hypothetical protein